MNNNINRIVTHEDSIQGLHEYVTHKLANELGATTMGDEYYYHSLPLAIIDAVFSAQALYTSVQNVVQRYSSKYKLPVFRSPREQLPPPEDQETVAALILKMKRDGIPHFIEHVFLNGSVTSGRKKAEILLELLEVFDRLQIQTFQDVQGWLNQPVQQKELINAITSIHGIGEATYRYLLMLSGDEQMVKPDRMILRFIKNAINENVNEAEAVSLIQTVSRQLLPQYPRLNPRLLDYIIWSWQREQDDQDDQDDQKRLPTSNPKKFDFHAVKPKQKENTMPTSPNGKLTVPQKTQRAMFKRYMR